MPTDRPHESDRPEDPVARDTSPQVEHAAEQLTDRPSAKPAFAAVETMLSERAAADRAAVTELERPDWRTPEWRTAEPTLRAAWRSHEARWARAETNDSPDESPDVDQDAAAEGAETADTASEPTTQLVRTEGDLRYELGTPEDVLDELELDDGDKSAYERARNEFSKRETVGNINDAGAEWVGLFEGVLDDRPQPSGAYVGTPDHPVIRQAPREAVDGGALVIAPIVLWAIGDGFVRWAHDKYGEWKQSRGDRGDAGN